ncbi:MAG: aminopeptidase P family protein [Candidatus Coatesbacteria bacterium]|nr:aminopeptidase P family protein [Candidatus Coatesbacteria bacterium]
MTEQMVLSRLQKVREELVEQGLDAIFAVHNEQIPNPNVRYLSGFSGSTAVLLISADEALIIADGRYYEQVEQEVEVFELRKLPVGTPYGDFIHETIKSMGIKSLGFDPDHTLYSSHQKLVSSLPNMELKAVHGIVENLRIAKCDEEIELIRQASNIAIKAFLKVIEIPVRGKSENEVAARLEYEMRLLGSERIAFETILCSGPRSSIIHGKPSENKLKLGDLVIFDFGAVYKGYCSDITRTCVVGEPNEEKLELHAMLQKAQHEAAAVAVPGAMGRDVDAVARKVITDAGYGDRFGHGLGHGLGLLVHEAPGLGPASEAKLQANSLVTIEPGVYFPGEGGMRLEDDFIVSEGGAIRVADGLAQELFVLRYE